MIGRGRPIRFVALVGAGWIGLRAMLLWPQRDPLPDALTAIVPLSAHAAEARETRVSLPTPAAHAAGGSLPTTATIRPRRAGAASGSEISRASFSEPGKDATPVRLLSFDGAQGGPAPISSMAPADRLSPLPQRWSASGWLVMRPGAGLGAAPGSGQLGGSQAGLRVAYMLAPAARLAAFGRIAAPLRGRGAEASLGLEWQPMQAPVRLVAEYRVGLDGIRGGPGVGLSGGVEVPLPAGFRLESYAQAGALHRARLEPYADGALRVTRAIAGRRARLAFGGGLWGAAQRGASRLDMGPSATLTVPIDGQAIRLALDWRQRIAGDARPGSGPALSVGADF